MGKEAKELLNGVKSIQDFHGVTFLYPSTWEATGQGSGAGVGGPPLGRMGIRYVGDTPAFWAPSQGSNPPKRKPPEPNGDGGYWRRVRDSNPRTALDRYTISNRAPGCEIALILNVFSG